MGDDVGHLTSATDSLVVAPTHKLPDLVARCIATAIMLKDEYFDRIVLERVALQHHLMECQRRRKTNEHVSESYEVIHHRVVANYISSISHHHLLTQSDSTSFDRNMLCISEHLLQRVIGPHRWRGLSGDDDDDDDELLALRRWLSPSELLEAQEVWNTSIFVKRPTKYFCTEVGLPTDEPFALQDSGIITSLEGIKRRCRRAAAAGKQHESTSSSAQKIYVT